MYRKVDLDKPVFCAKCGKEIVRDSNSINLNINVHACGYAFCKNCKKKLNEFAGKKVEEYENALVKQFVSNNEELIMKPKLVKILVKDYDLPTDEGMIHVSGEVALGVIRKDGSFYGMSFDCTGTLEGETKYSKEELMKIGVINEI